MHKIIRLISLASTIIAMTARDGLAQTSGTNDSMLHVYDQIEHQLSVIETNKTTKAIKVLDRAIDDLNCMPFTDRKKQATIWLEIVTMIDNNLDTNFDITVPHYSIILLPPPDGKNGIQHQPGVPPETLKDPEARSDYMVAINENNKRKIKSELQIALYHLNERTSEDFESFLRTYYASSEADQSEISELFAKSKLSTARIETLKKAVVLAPDAPPNKNK